MRRLLALATAAVATVALAAPAADAKPFTYTDAKGELPANPGLDIVGVTYATEGTTTATKVRGRTVKTYTPSKLVVTMTLAGAPVEQPGIRYRAESDIAECGNVTFNYTTAVGEAALALSDLTVGCGGGGGTTGGDTLFLDPKVAIKGSKIIWSIPLKALPKQARAGALMYGFQAGVDLADPVLATLGPDDTGDALFDTASSDGDWEVS